MNITQLDDINWGSVNEGDRFRFANNTLIKILGSNETVGLAADIVGGPSNCKSITTSYEAYQLVNHGTWWSSWEEKSGFGYCNLDPGQWSTYDFSVSWTIGSSIAIDAGIDFEEIITLMLGVGVSIDHSISTTEEMSCACQGNVPSCVWEQSRFTWSDSQRQSCTRYQDCNGEVIDCGSWSGYQRTNAPVKNDYSAFNFGCSSGSAC